MRSETIRRARDLSDAGVVEFADGATPEDIESIEVSLGVTLPDPFKDFLRRFGGGGAPGAEISGWYGPSHASDFGTVVGDTVRLRELLGLPVDLVVIQSGDDETPWCLETDHRPGPESAVLSFDGGQRTKLYPDFESFFVDYLHAWSRES